MGAFIETETYEEVSSFTDFIFKFNLQEQFEAREGMKLDDWDYDVDDQTMIETYIEEFLKGFWIVDYESSYKSGEHDYFTLQQIKIPSKEEQIMEAI